MNIPSNTPTSERGFWALTGLQFQGAFSDNIIKMIMLQCVALVYAAAPRSQGVFTGIITVMMPLAFLIFSCWAGFAADKYSKRIITLATKILELGIMTLALAIFALTAAGHNPTGLTLWLGLIVMFLMFAQSALFSPAKYGIIPELVREERLGWANGVIALTTNISIILGNTVANEAFRVLQPAGRLHWVMVGLVALAVAGWACGRLITRTPAANPERSIDVNFFPELKRYTRVILADRNLALTIAGLSYFWGLGAMLLTHMLLWGQQSLGLSAIGAGRLFVLVALGIGAGSGLAGWISRRGLEVGLIPLGGLGLSLFALPLTLASPDWRLVPMLSLIMLTLCGGLFSVPLNAILQQKADPRDRGGILAASNYASNLAMLASGLLYILMIKAGFSPNSIFLVLALASMAATWIILRLMPEALLRLVVLVVTRTLYRIRAHDVENIPAKGPALLVANHISFIDALLIQAACPRPVRFVAWQGMFEKPLLGRLLRLMRTIPVASTQRPRELQRSLQTAAHALEEGELVCIFVEGQITRTGLLLPFRKGYELILRQHPAPIVPVCLEGVWGSIFSFDQGKFFWKWPARLPYPVRLVFGAPLPAETSATALRQTIMELAARAAILSKPDTPLLHHSFVRQARRHWRRSAMMDLITPAMSFGQVLLRTVILARRLRTAWAGQQNVGILLPPSVGAALVNYAAALGGRTAVNLNYTIGTAGMEQCARQAELKTVVTSRRFLEKAGLAEPAGALFLEDYAGFRGAGEVAAAALAAFLLPVRLLEKFCGAKHWPTADTPAAIIFSSGSTGAPKGVVLSHFNIASNIRSFRQGVRLSHQDKMLSTLPFFHSFGYTVLAWGGVTIPFQQVFHANPTDLKTVGELCASQKVSVMITTPTFLQQYLRRLEPGQLGSLNTVVAGAEKLTDPLREQFAARFGVEPLQGYGTTELSPVVSVNVDHFRSAGFYQVGHKRGSIGHPIPGVAVRVVDLETGVPLEPGQTGLLQATGPNVMQGYLNQPEKTAQVIRQGWYDTGDIAYIDPDGFIFITDRLARFSKIGGEMVPHGTVEEKLRELATVGAEEGLVVTGLPDPAKGERLAVLHTLDPARLEGAGEKLAAAGLPNLWIPRREMFFRIDQIPVLGTGKLDLRGIKDLAARLAGEISGDGGEEA